MKYINSKEDADKYLKEIYTCIMGNTNVEPERRNHLTDKLKRIVNSLRDNKYADGDSQ